MSLYFIIPDRGSRMTRRLRMPRTWSRTRFRLWVIFFGVLVPSCLAQEMPRNSVPQGCPDATVSASQDAEETETEEIETDESVDLLAGEFSKTWQVFSSDPVKDEQTIWKIVRDPQGQERQLECSGEPKGFVFTNAEYANFELSLEWRYPADANGNSGILVFMQNEPRIWPTSVQIQLHQPKAGSIFPGGDAVSQNTVENPPELVRPVNMWNLCRVVSRDGTVSVEINGKKAGEVTGARPSSGRIGLQSEGSIVQFRRIRIRSLSPPSQTSASTDPKDVLKRAPAQNKQTLPSP